MCDVTFSFIQSHTSMLLWLALLLEIDDLHEIYNNNNNNNNNNKWDLIAKNLDWTQLKCEDAFKIV